MDVPGIIDSGKFQPCTIRLRISEKDTREYHCESCFRLLKGRRMTVLASSASKSYVIKIFPRRHKSLEEYEKEITGYELLHSASIDIPPRIYYGPAEDDLTIIVYQYISRARTLKTVYGKKPSSRQLNVLSRLVSRLHDRGLIHEDPHLDNFLLKGDNLTVLDMGAVRQVNNPAVLEKNYGLFVAQLPVSWQLEKPFLETYLENKQVDEQKLQHLHEQVVSSQQWRENHYLKKIFRECSAFAVHSTIFGKLIVDRDYSESGIVELLDDPSRVFDDAILLKKGNSSTVGYIELAGHRLVVKRYNIKNQLHRLKQLFGESRAVRSWRNAHRMLLRGLPTAKPVAVLECLKGKLKGVTVFVMEHVEGVGADEYFRDQAITASDMRTTAQRMLGLIDEIHTEGLLHGDLKSTNFIITPDSPVLVDLDSMKLVEDLSYEDERRTRERERFFLNWEKDESAKMIFADLLSQEQQGDE